MFLKFGMRHLQIFLIFMLLLITTGIRVQLPIAIVAMTEPFTSSNPDVPVYDWTNKNLVLSSFFWGFVIFQIPAGNWGRLYGTKYILLGAMFMSAASCCITPFSSEKFGSYGAIVCAFLGGLAQGFYFPAIFINLAKWSPKSEIGTLNTLAFAGSPCGNIVGMPIVGFMSSSWAGWPSTFYLYGGLGFLWMIFYYWLGADSPSSCPYVSMEEKKYIESDLNQETNKNAIPWKAIFTNAPFWATFLMGAGLTWSYQTLMAEIPNYMNKILKFDIKSENPICLRFVKLYKKVNMQMESALSVFLLFLQIVPIKIIEKKSGLFKITQKSKTKKYLKALKVDLFNGILSATPYIANFFLIIVFGYLADYLVNTNKLTLTNTRKLFTAIGSVVPAVALLVLGYLPENDTTISILMLVLAIGVTSSTAVGNNINHVDLSPNFSGILLGIRNTFSQFISIFGPTAVHVFIKDEEDKSQWTIIFIISALMYLVPLIYYLIYASADVQAFDAVDNKNDNRNKPRLSLPAI